MSKILLSEWILKRRVIHRSIRELLVRIISPDFNNGHHFEADFFGMSWPGVSNNHIDYQVLLRGGYEKFMLFFMRDIFSSVSKEKAVFIDVGANIGNHSLFMSKEAASVHAFEPYEPARRILERKIKNNRIRNITVHPVGLSNRCETIPFYPPNLSNLGTGSFEKEHCTYNGQVTESLEVAIGDDEISENGISDICLIKIDVEGHEPRVIEGLRKTLINNRPVVIFESSPTTREALEKFEDMQALFPEAYSFFIFSVKNKKNGYYRLKTITSIGSMTNNEIIAMPNEKSGMFQ